MSSHPEPKPEQESNPPSDPEAVVDRVRQRYGRIAAGVEPGCCGPAPGAAGAGAASGSPVGTGVSLSIGYGDRDLTAVPEGADLGLGCGAPIGFLDLQPGETVLDLGSGAGLDAFLAARRVGPGGRAIGVDMTPEMIDRARANAAEGGFTQVEFRQGRLEALPLPDASVDAVTSNCVINLVPDKASVFREVARVLRPGGRMVVSDIILDGRLPEVIERDIMAYVGCVAGAMQRQAYFAAVGAAGLARIEILRDVDYLASAGFTLPDELRHRMEAAGLRPEDLAGRVRSVTFRAVRPAGDVGLTS